MKKRQHSLAEFQKNQIDKEKCKTVKGGYKYGPTGTGFYGSFIWENIDIRDQSAVEGTLGGKLSGPKGITR
jgi:hypothetical protein